MNKPSIKNLLNELSDNKSFIESSFYILDKNRKKVPFILNELQNEFMDTKTGKDAIIKARKAGFSSVIVADTAVDCATMEKQNAVTLAHTEKDTLAHIEKAEFYLKHSNIPIRYKRTKDNIEFLDTGSNWIFYTASAREFGRGSDITHLHLTEFCHYPHWTFITGAVEACLPNAKITYESTANGAGNPSHTFVTDADTNRNDYKLHFYAWHDLYEYRIKNAGVPETYSEEEIKLIKDHGLNSDQIAWRRWKLRNMPSPHLFPQEFPSSLEEAFLTSGHMVFDYAALRYLKETLAKPMHEGELHDTGAKIIIVKTGEKLLKIYEPPKRGVPYLISADISQGIDGADKSSVSVLDCNKHTQVAHFNGYRTPMEMADMIELLGKYYHYAMLAIEYNSPGNSTVDELIRRGYPNMYLDEHNRGFKTNIATRSACLQTLIEMVAARTIKINSANTLVEMGTFVYKPEKSKMEHSDGAHDDCVIEIAIGAYLMRLGVVISRNEKPLTAKEMLLNSRNNVRLTKNNRRNEIV